MKINKSITKWCYYQDANVFRLLIHLLIMSDKNGVVETTHKDLSIETGISIQTLRTCLNRLITEMRIKKTSNMRKTTITICKSDDYSF